MIMKRPFDPFTDRETPTTSVPCGIGDHEGCGGEGCECECHA